MILNKDMGFARPFAGLAAGLVMAGASPLNAQVALPEIVEAAPLATDPFSTGTLTPANGALPATLWQGTSPQTLEFLFENLPPRPTSPSLGEVMRRTLLSPGTAPDGARPSLGGKKLLALARAGFAQEAATVASLSSAGRGDPWTSRSEAVSDLLNGDIQGACVQSSRLTSGREDPFWVRMRVLCYAQAGERDAADLSLGILRDQYGISPDDDLFLSAVVTGVAPKQPPAPSTPLQFAIAKSLGWPVSPGLLAKADGGVLVAVARDASADLATRIDAAQRALSMGVFDASGLAAILASAEFDLVDLGNAGDIATARPNDPLTDAVLYQSVMAMTAPEFMRDKAQRIARALSLPNSFYRAYAMSVLYADEIAALEGALLAPSEAAYFAQARMAVGDTVGAGAWLSAMIAPGESVGALPEALGLRFIELVNMLAMLDPQTASQIARAGDVSILNPDNIIRFEGGARPDPAVAAHILEAAFDAAIGEKQGQAALVALAASGSAMQPSDAVIVAQSLKAAGLEDLQRRYRFERAWAAKFPGDAADGTTGEEMPNERGFAPRLKPTGNE